MPDPIPQNRNASEQYVPPGNLPPALRPQAPGPISRERDAREVSVRSHVLFGFFRVGMWVGIIGIAIWVWQISSPIATFLSSASVLVAPH